MTEPEDEIRHYVEVVGRAQRPVELSEIVGRRRSPRRSPRMLAVVALAAAVVVVAASVAVVDRNRDQRGGVEVSPVPSTRAGAAVANDACAAASLRVTGTRGERLHPDTLPAGFVLTEGSESELGARGELNYTIVGGAGPADPPRITLLRYHASVPLSQLTAGTSRHPATVRGRSAVVTTGGPGPFVAVAWSVSPGTDLVVSGYKIDETELLAVAAGLRYSPGSSFPYPAHPAVEVSRARAIALARGGAGATAILSSVGEVDALAHRNGPVNHQPTIAPGRPVTTPVWVVTWPSDAPRLIDADSGADLGGSGVPATLTGLTDRSLPGCEPPFGVLTRSEILALRPPQSGVTESATLTTLTRFAASGAGSGFADCSLSACEPNVPVWVLVSTAGDQRFTEQESRPCCATPSTAAGSWQVIAYDARTGPQTTETATVSLGSGTPPAALAAIPDLSKP